MKRFFALSFLLLVGNASHASSKTDILLIERTQAPTSAPFRGMTMAEVEGLYGPPRDRLDPRGGQKKQWPTINRWVYPEFTVYFERSHVVDVVINRTSPSETGPKPPIR